MHTAAHIGTLKSQVGGHGEPHSLNTLPLGQSLPVALPQSERKTEYNYLLQCVHEQVSYSYEWYLQFSVTLLFSPSKKFGSQFSQAFGIQRTFGMAGQEAPAQRPILLALVQVAG